MKNLFSAVLVALVFAVLSLVLSPFQYDVANSGRYLLPVLQDLDPGLFPDDPAVESLRRFGSGFYALLSWILVTTGVHPHNLELVMAGLFAVTRWLFGIGLIWLVWGLVETLQEKRALALVLLVWFSIPSGVSIAGVTIGSATMNHSSVSEVVMVFSLGVLILRRFVWAGALNAADVWVHPLMALHRMAAMAPAMLAGSRDRHHRRRVVAAFALCSASVVLYWLVLAPPALGRQEAEIFIAAKGVMVHTSPFVQPWSAWVEAVSLLALAGFATRSFTAGLSDARFRLLWWAIASGVAIALLLSALTHVMQLPFLIRLQPMRIFMLPWFGAELLIGIGAVRGFLTRDSSWPWMAAVIATSMLHGGLHVIVTAVAAIVLVLQVCGRRVAWHWLESPFIFGAFVAAMVGADLASVRSIHFMVGTVVLVVVFLASILESRPRIQATGVLMATVIAAGVSSWMYFRVEHAESTNRPRVDPEYNRVLEWIRDNTPDRARFATEPGLGFFRTRSHRSSVNETISAIVWVDPHQSVEEMKRANAAMVLWQQENLPWEHQALNQKSTKLDFEYVLTRQRDFLGTEPEFTSGPFHVFRVR